MSVQLRWIGLGLALMAMIGFGTVAGNGVFAQDSTATPGVTSDDSTTSADAEDDNDKDRDNDDRHGRDKKGKSGPGFGRAHVDIDALATFLGVTADDITTGLKAGSSLAEIAEANGITRDELKAFLVQQYEAGLDAFIDSSRDDVKSDTDDGVGGVDDATPSVDATPAATTGMSV